MTKRIKIILRINSHLQTNQFKLLLKILQLNGKICRINTNNSNNNNSSNQIKNSLFKPSVLRLLKIAARRKWMGKSIYQKKWLQKNINYICKLKWSNYKITQLRATIMSVGITLMLAAQLLRTATATTASVLQMKLLLRIQQSKRISKKLISLHRNSLSPIQVTYLLVVNR